ncbi:GON30 protein [Haematococcus lacustris]
MLRMGIFGAPIACSRPQPTLYATAPRVCASPASSPRPTNCRATATLVSNNGVTTASVINQTDLNSRHDNVVGHFPSALGVDDFMARLEVALSGFGFTGDNTIAMTNLCRDEVTIPLKDKIESVFGGSFNTNGLGAVLTCGVTGMGAGLSHSPVCDGKEHYVFFAFPHIAINSAGEVGAIARPGRQNKSCACGALQKCLNELRAEGSEDNCKVPGVHDPLDPEYSILKQRLARRARYERVDTAQLDLVSITKLAARTIANDLEFLVEKAVDTNKANYAVVTGVQIHNWAVELTEESGVPSLEFVAWDKCYVVVNGHRTYLDLSKVPALSPRQLQLMAKASITKQKEEEEYIIGKTSAGTLKEIPLKYLTQRLGVTKDPGDLPSIPELQGWTANIVTTGQVRDPLAPNMADSDYTSFQVFGQPNLTKEAVLDATPAAVTALLAEIQNLSSRVVDLEKRTAKK